MIPTEKLKPLPDHKTMIQFVASPELMAKLEELKHLLAHQNFEGRMDVLIEKLADIALKKLKPALSPAPGKKEMATHNKAALQIASTQHHLPLSQSNKGQRTSMRSRYIPSQVRRQVLQRDQNGCTYQDPKTGRVCGARQGLQLDHIFPFSWGGEHSADNLALRCGAHNRLRAKQMRLVQ